jgi:hypothetical protein
MGMGFAERGKWERQNKEWEWENIEWWQNMGMRNAEQNGNGENIEWWQNMGIRNAEHGMWMVAEWEWREHRMMAEHGNEKRRTWNRNGGRTRNDRLLLQP